MLVCLQEGSMGQKNSMYMVNPTTWTTRDAQLHIACGKGIVLSEGGSVAQRKDASRQPKDGLVHTAWPVAIGRLFQVCTLNILTNTHTPMVYHTHTHAHTHMRIGTHTHHIP